MSLWFYKYVLVQKPTILSVSVFFICISVTDEDTVKRYYAKFEEQFFQTCEKELLKINTFYSGNGVHRWGGSHPVLDVTKTSHINLDGTA